MDRRTQRDCDAELADVRHTINYQDEMKAGEPVDRVGDLANKW